MANDPENWTGLAERPEAPGETPGFMNHPTINVSWFDAMAFATGSAADWCSAI